MAITTVKEVLISCLNLHRFWQFNSFVFSAFNDQFEKLYQTIEAVFHQVSAPRFSTHFAVSVSLCLIYYIKVAVKHFAFVSFYCSMLHINPNKLYIF